VFRVLDDVLIGRPARFDLAGYLRALIGHGTELPDVQAPAIILGDAGETPSLVVLTPHQPTLGNWATCGRVRRGIPT
jgi:hypothetical protein